jgi:hypothetical protein
MSINQNNGSNITGRVVIRVRSDIFGDNDTIIAACFDLVETYDTEIGPLFVLGSPIQSFDRNSATNELGRIRMAHSVNALLR